MNTKLIGGILLIVGTAIGGGMLALPIVSAQLGFIDSTLLLFASWIIMTASAFLILEVNLWLPADSNIISMAKATLGKWGEIIAWLACLLLLYSLISAYIAGGGDFLRNLLTEIHINTPQWLASILFTVFLGYVVYRGIKSVDYLNRGLMFTKLGVYVFLVALVLFFINPNKLLGGQLKYIAIGITVMITSFSFATIVPSLRSYFHDDVKKLRVAILIGSLIPLLCYILWDLAIMGVISRPSLTAMIHSSHSTSDLANTLTNNLNIETITFLMRTFTSICLATSFLGVSLSLSDFLADGLKIRKVGKGKLFIGLITFAPPLIIVLLDPRIFIAALSYAGIYCVVLLALLPALMAWQGRYKKQLAGEYQMFGGKILLLGIIITSVAIIVASATQSI